MASAVTAECVSSQGTLPTDLAVGAVIFALRRRQSVNGTVPRTDPPPSLGSQVVVARPKTLRRQLPYYVPHVRYFITSLSP